MAVLVRRGRVGGGEVGRSMNAWPKVGGEIWCWIRRGREEEVWVEAVEVDCEVECVESCGEVGGSSYMGGGGEG